MKSRPRDVAIAYLCSGILHAGLVAVTILLLAPLFMKPDWTSVINTAVGGDVNEPFGADVETESAQPPINPEAFPSEEGHDVLADSDLGDSRIAAYARQKLQQAREAAAEKSLDEQLAELESLGRQLNQVSNEESVTAMAEAIAPLIGSGSRATEPAEDMDDSVPFDHATAQLYAVHRHGEEGAYEYSATMLDAAGRTQQLPLDEADGAELFKLFEMMKKFPLLETVYRKAVLGLLDTIMAEERAGEAADPAESANPQQPASDESEQNKN